MPSLPSSARYVIIGAGIHGLSTAMHLAGRLRSKGTTVGAGPNRIVVLEKGEVVEMGSHDQLMKKRGLYYELASKQVEQ